MSTTGVTKIREKIVQRRGDNLLKKIEGLESGVLARYNDYELTWHRDVIKENSKNESKPTRFFPIADSFEVIFVCFEEFTKRFGNEFLVRFEWPFVLQVKIRESKKFLESFYGGQGTKDLVILKIHPDALFEVQELEYDIKLFVAANSLMGDCKS